MNPKTVTRLGALVLNRPTLTQIAREAGVSVSFVSQIAAGKKNATNAVKEAAARVLAMPVDEIFGKQESR